MAKSFVSSKKVIEYEDKTEGKIVGKGLFPENFLGVETHFTMSIDVKDNKLRVTFDNIFLQIDDVKRPLDTQRGMNKFFIPAAKETILELKQYVSKTDTW